MYANVYVNYKQQPLPAPSPGHRPCPRHLPACASLLPKMWATLLSQLAGLLMGPYCNINLPTSSPTVLGKHKINSWRDLEKGISPLWAKFAKFPHL
jgi:hypothetical protein